jgi:hypothetical protein
MTMTFGSSRLPVMVVCSSSTRSVTWPRATRGFDGGVDEDAGTPAADVAVELAGELAVELAAAAAVAVEDGVVVTAGDSAGVGGAALATKAQPAVNQKP